MRFLGGLILITIPILSGFLVAGGKMARVCILMKNLVRNIRKKMVPDRTVLLTYYHKGTEKELLENILRAYFGPGSI